MRLPYQFNEKTDPKDTRWGMNAERLVADYTTWDRNNHYADSLGVERRIDRLTEAMGGLADLLISKGVLSPQDFLEAIGADSVYEVRPNNSHF